MTKELIAQALFHEKQIDSTTERLTELLAKTFSVLANLNPEVALDCLEQMSSQLTQDDVDELLESRQEYIDNLSTQINLGDE